MKIEWFFLRVTELVYSFELNGMGVLLVSQYCVVLMLGALVCLEECRVVYVRPISAGTVTYTIFPKDSNLINKINVRIIMNI